MAKILIIDNRSVNRQFLTTLLGYQHHDLREASDGVEGLRAARDQRSDLIISDVLMPTMDGYEFVRQLRQDPDIGQTPVIFSTAHYLSSESRALAKQCGVTSIIYKPCEPQDVLDIVAVALGEQPLRLPATLRQPQEFDREHLRLVTDKVSEKADQLRESHEKLTALIELSTDLAQERDPVQLLDRICSVAREVIGARWTMVVLLEPSRKTIQHLKVAGIQLQDSAALRSALLENGVFKTVTQEGRTICLSDVTSTPVALRLPEGLPRAASLLVAPLVMRGHVDGWLCLADKLGFDEFSEQDEQLAPALAGQMAVAYANARLYSDSVQAREELLASNQRLAQALSELQGKSDELAAMSQQLWQASKLATMGELSASIAHELNNPLATVGLRAEALLMQMPEDSDTRKPLEIISREVERMASLVNNLLQFSRRSHPQVSTVDLREEIAASLEFVHYHLRSHNIEVVREFAGVLPTIQADSQRLQQLFLNLLTNASDAMPRGGKLTVRAGSSGLDNSAITIEFADSGDGISEANMEKIWEPFFTTKAEGKGTGLGLAICRRIVEEHGGTIAIQSQAGRGTTVRIVLSATNDGAPSSAK
jgi:signal transduction histidine kinase/DNA-binding response OmpR family regulator